MRRTILPLAAMVLLSGCIAGQLPTVRTDQIEVRGIGLEGLTLAVRLVITNERHSDTIHLDALRVHVTVADQDLGVVDVPEAVDLPPNEPVIIESDVSVPVTSLPDLALAAAGGPVPYHLDGRAHVLNIGWTVDFEYDGDIPQNQIMGAAVPAIPFGLLP
ncbi:MAG: LEA type 2 family protein [Sandaracinaceae bacterium]|nr:LEA type 2 family protein [Sandaracinaceae bacterium]